MKLSDALSRVDEYSKDLPSGCYLAHAFFMDDGRDEWQVGFVNPDDESIIVFVVSEDSVTKNPPSEAFKKPEDVIAPLRLEEVKVPASQALAAAKKHLSEKYPTHPLKQAILLLQVLDGSQVYNITLVTETFYLLNLKLASSSGEVVSEEFDHLMKLRQE
ncbi:MAG: hypothetical protein ACMXYD_03120 [Candidatus Woesearchaeota archaeon]